MATFSSDYTPLGRNGTVMSRADADSIQAQMVEALATLSFGARVGSTYDFRTKTWTQGTGPTDRRRGALEAVQHGIAPREPMGVLEIDAPDDRPSR